MAKNKNKTWHDHVSKASAKAFMYLKQLAIPLGLAVVTAGLFLMFGPFLTPFGLGVAANTLIALTVGGGVFLAVKAVSWGIRRCIEPSSQSPAATTIRNTMRMGFHTIAVLGGVGAAAALITLAATSMMGPMAMTAGSIVFLTAGAGLGTALLLRESITVLQNVFTIFLNLIKPSPISVNKPTSSLAASTTLIAKQSNSHLTLNNSYSNTSKLIGPSSPASGATTIAPLDDLCNAILKPPTHNSPMTTVVSASNDATQDPKSVSSNSLTM